jgi:nonribosomal peptide synthetase DhbF
MIPARVTILDALPLTPYGKIDRKALPPPAARGPQTDGAGAKEPDSDLKNSIAKIWKELLGVPRVSIDSDFFAIGGHSLLAIRLQIRLRDELGMRVSMAGIVQAPTIQGLAEAVTQSA